MSTTNDFLDEDYEVPSSGGNFMKLEQGENRFRILSRPVLGWSGWDNDNKVHRFPYKQKPSDTSRFKDPLRHFWAMIVYNSALKSIQLLEISTGYIQSRISELSKNQEWGPPYGYDLIVTKTGEKKLTKYIVMPCPKATVNKEIEKMAYDKPMNLDALFVENGDPFNVSNGKSTPLIINDLPF